MHAEKIIGKPDTDKIRQWMGSDGRKILVYHRDADGVCSAAIFLKFFPDFETVPREGPIVDNEFLKTLVSKKPGVLVFLDIPVDQEWKKILKLVESLPKLRIMILDHHIPVKNMNSASVIHINPMFHGDAYIPASCVIFHLFRKMGFDVDPWMWISIIGLIGDYGMKDCGWMMKEYNEKKLDPPIASLFRASDIISSAITLKGVDGAEKSLRLITRSSKFEDLRHSEELQKWNKTVQSEVRKIVDDFEKRKEVVSEKKLIFYEIRSKMNITSIIATITAEKHPDSIIIIRKKSGDSWKISLRCQEGKISVGDLAKYASTGIGSGGGHVKSSGALVNSWEEFKERVFEYLK
jgi:single-stranded DNA-specific DHH superfamily exonuclease